MRTRREFLQTAGLVSGATLLASSLPDWIGLAQGQGDQLAQMRAQMGAAPITSQTLGDRLTLLAGPGGNVVVLTGPDGKVVIDTFVQPAWTNLKATLDKMGSEPIATLIDTHWHFDHADNNENFRKAGAAILAHDNTKKRLGESHELLGREISAGSGRCAADADLCGQRISSPQTASRSCSAISHRLTPTRTFPSSSRRPTCSTWATYSSTGCYPFIDVSTGGSINGMINGATLGMKLADATTKIVPGHGAFGDLASLTKYRDVLVTVRDRVAKLKKSGQTLDQVVAAAPTKDLDATWGKGFMSPANFLGIVYNTIQ